MGRYRRALLVSAALVGVGWATACGDESIGPSPPPSVPPSQPRPTSVSVSPPSTTLASLGATVQLSVEVRDQNGQVMAGASVSWATGDTAVASVDATGLVTAASNGTATVTATAGTVSGDAVVTVMQSAGSVVVSPPAATVAQGDTVRLVAEVLDENGHRVEGAEFTWASSDASVATVDASGLVAGVAEGAATITATAGDARGTAQITVENPDRAALVALYNATDGPNWVDNDNWLTDAPLGDWHGVETDQSGRVVGVVMSHYDSDAREWRGNNLSGPIPPELGGLRGLKRLNLKANDLSGSIPPELGGLVGLERLELDGNVLTGPIPPELGNLASLTLLRLGGNNLSGPIPAELGNLAALTWLSLGTGELSGPIPAELGNLAELTFLRLSGNTLTGPVPAELGNLANLTDLWLYQNDLSGPIPPELGKLVKLAKLYLYNNSLTDRIPAELASMDNLRILHLKGNDLSGPIPPELASLAELEQLSLYDNRLTDLIPRSLLDSPALTVFRFHRNDGLCAPGTTDFADWLNGLARYEGPFCNESDEDALRSLFETAGGAGWTKDQGWLDGPVLSGWYGVSADALGRVTALDLTGNALSGRLPRSIGVLAHLTELKIGANPALSGRLPSSLVDLPLRTLHYPGTDLCAPTEPAFREWLNAIPSHEGTEAECGALSDREILRALYEATGGPDWTNRENWLTDAPLGDWHGVRVDGQGRVIEISLLANDLRGSMPTELGSLASLERLSLSRNRLSGAIPSELGNLANLQRLSFNSNALEGPIPPELGRLANLQRLSLEDNALEGVMPVALGGLSRLQELDLAENRLEGPIPPEFSNLGNIRYLELADNNLTGPIPPELGSLSNMRRLSLSRNGLTDSLPPELARLANLEGLYLGDNALEGRVPAEFGGLAGLRELALSGNPRLSGVLPASLTNLQSLTALLAGGTGLCAPADANFGEWLEHLSSRRVTVCETMPATAYLVQGVQSREFPVPLVAGEEALLRVFVTAARSNHQRLPPVRASFYLGGAVAQAVDIPGRPGPIPTDVDEGSLAKSVNDVIPAEVIRPGLEMVIEIDPARTLDPGLGITTRIPETGRMPIEVREMPVFDLTVIPFLWSADPDSAILEQTVGMAADPAGHELLELTRILMPVGELRVTAHEPVLSSSNNAYVLLAETRAIRALEGGSGHYMATISGAFTGAAGLASRPGRTSFARNRSSTIAHELGHNMSLRHGTAPGAGGVDPAYPYPGGAIGVWAYDFRHGGRLVPPSARDVMAGGGLESWISDYHFDKAFRFRLADEGVSGPESPASSLLLWGGVDSLGVPYLEPAFVVDAPPALGDSAGEYRIIGRTATDAELFSVDFSMPDVADGDGSSSFALIVPVGSGIVGDLVRVTLSGPGGSVTVDRDSDLPVAILRDPRTGQIRGILRDLPHPAQAQTIEAAGLGVGLGLEVLFSRGIPDAGAWRR